jgi:CheY-like chemotaxis protein
MRDLVCDDDPATRFVIRRVLSHSAGCEVVECTDGTEALEHIENAPVDLLILDLQMPTLDGLEVLEILRAGDFKNLPVIVLTSERREEVVKWLIRLGIVGYVTKPLSPARLLPLVERTKALARTRTSDLPRDAIRLGRSGPTLLIDGSPEYRELFVAYAQRFGEIRTAESGLLGLAAFKYAPVRLVFVGKDLGVIGSELVARKLRGMTTGEPLRLVAIRDDAADATPPEGFDDVVVRSDVQSVHEEQMRRFLPLAGSLGGVNALVGDLSALLLNSVPDTIGLALDVPIEETSCEAYTADWRTTVDVDVQQQFNLTVDMPMSTRDARAVTARLLSLKPEAVVEGDLRASLSELLNLLVGRLNGALGGRAHEHSLPRVELHSPVLVETPQEAEGLRLQFALGDLATLVIVVRVGLPKKPPQLNGASTV